MPVTTRNALAAGVGAVAAAGLAFFATRTRAPEDADDNAPRRTGRKSATDDYALVGKTVTISKPSRAELFSFWRDFSNLPSFMENLESVVTNSDGTMQWKIAAPAGGTVTLVTRIENETEGSLIAWKSTDASEVATTGQVRFRDAPAGRGTQVELEIAYDPPFGTAGRAIATLFQREPKLQARRDLRRFKMLMETGEISTSDNRAEEAA